MRGVIRPGGLLFESARCCSGTKRGPVLVLVLALLGLIERPEPVWLGCSVPGRSKTGEVVMRQQRLSEVFRVPSCWGACVYVRVSVWVRASARLTTVVIKSWADRLWIFWCVVGGDTSVGGKSLRLLGRAERYKKVGGGGVALFLCGLFKSLRLLFMWERDTSGGWVELLR